MLSRLELGRSLSLVNHRWTVWDACRLDSGSAARKTRGLILSAAPRRELTGGT